MQGAALARQRHLPCPDPCLPHALVLSCCSAGRAGKARQGAKRARWPQSSRAGRGVSKRKAESKPQWDVASPPLGWLVSKRQETTGAGEGAETRAASPSARPCVSAAAKKGGSSGTGSRKLCGVRPCASAAVKEGGSSGTGSRKLRGVPRPTSASAAERNESRISATRSLRPTPRLCSASFSVPKVWKQPLGQWMEGSRKCENK